MELDPKLQNDKQIKYCLDQLQPLNPKAIDPLYDVLDQLVKEKEHTKILELVNILIDKVESGVQFEDGDKLHRFIIEYQKVVDEYCYYKFSELNN